MRYKYKVTGIKGHTYFLDWEPIVETNWYIWAYLKACLYVMKYECGEANIRQRKEEPKVEKEFFMSQGARYCKDCTKSGAILGEPTCRETYVVQTPIQPVRRNYSPYELNQNNDCKFFEFKPEFNFLEWLGGIFGKKIF